MSILNTYVNLVIYVFVDFLFDSIQYIAGICCMVLLCAYSTHKLPSRPHMGRFLGFTGALGSSNARPRMKARRADLMRGTYKIRFAWLV